MSTETASKSYRYKRKMMGVTNPVKNPGPPHRKRTARLESRLKDYATMMNEKNNQSLHSRKETGGYHRPGSNTK